MTERVVNVDAGDALRTAALVERLLAAARLAGTPRGHLAIKSTSEGAGVCNTRHDGSHAASCDRWRAAIAEAEAWLAERVAQRVAAHRVVQGALLDAEPMGRQPTNGVPR